MIKRIYAQYNAHNADVMEYFRHRPQDLLVLNVATPSAYDHLCEFLEKPHLGKEFPWENKTADKEARSAAPPCRFHHQKDYQKVSLAIRTALRGRRAYAPAAGSRKLDGPDRLPPLPPDT
jgi:hypothetical protein